MPADQPTILATSGGYRSGSRAQIEFNSLVHHAVELSGAVGKPRVTHLGIASAKAAKSRTTLQTTLIAEPSALCSFELL